MTACKPMFYPRKILLAMTFGAALAAAVPGAAWAQEGAQIETLVEDVAEALEETADRRPAGSWVWMPIPILNPTVDAGLAVAALHLYKLHPEAPVSTTGAGGFGTTNGSKGGGLFTKNYLRADRLRLTGAIGYGDVNLDFFGIGNDAPDRNRLKLNQRGTFGFGQLLWRLRDNLYGGLRLRYLSLSSRLRYAPPEDQFSVPPEELLALKLDLDSIGPGLKFEWDTRDDTWFPTGGHFAQFSVDSSRESLGSDRNYEIYNLNWAGFWPVRGGDVLAVNATACSASDKAPFYDICLIGSSKNLRGYAGGRYRDDTMLTGQVEYRKQLTSRWGMVFFGGLGQVADNWGDYTRDNIRTSAGLGVRWVASEAHGVRLSIDLAWGEGGDSAAYFYIGEAF